MKGYQVYKGELDHLDHQIWNLSATFLDKEKALKHCLYIVEQEKESADTVLDEGWSSCGSYRIWWGLGWDDVGICKIEEIEITE